ncbi:pimeloyl-ACP methyl ester carboxylesterase [Inquilinus ginsengisoli]|uniref:Pimeloyl-ACP methyl ester carboxylesterase n=1 Tax=Inquilinus ginsengisoli TaxID=363840 RepID=A0ABU1JLX4_9PROT|nr:alpha/beta hydrolase [Inquilinus ginsengisoli]MDR6289616.1 pimeloyl-ACP methyl ester carboxylesterase [Inquilinus ginsengisoli]
MDPRANGQAPLQRSDGFIRIDGHRLYWQRLDPPGGAGRLPLLLLHEGLGSVAQWTRRDVDVAARLAAATGHPVLAQDRLGFGRSDPLPGPRGERYLYEEARETLPRVLDALGVDRAGLVGHSDGGSIALLFAAAHPGRAAWVVSEAAHVIVEDVTLAGIAVAHAAFHAPDSRLRAVLARYHGDKTDFTFANWAELWPTPGFRSFDMRDALPSIRCPVLAIQGAEDEYGTEAQLDAIKARVSGPCEIWLVPDCRHAPHFEATDRVLPRIVNFAVANGS